MVLARGKNVNIIPAPQKTAAGVNLPKKSKIPKKELNMTATPLIEMKPTLGAQKVLSKAEKFAVDFINQKNLMERRDAIAESTRKYLGIKEDPLPPTRAYNVNVVNTVSARVERGVNPNPSARTNFAPPPPPPAPPRPDVVVLDNNGRFRTTSEAAMQTEAMRMTGTPSGTRRVATHHTSTQTDPIVDAPLQEIVAKRVTQQFPVEKKATKEDIDLAVRANNIAVPYITHPDIQGKTQTVRGGHATLLEPQIPTRGRGIVPFVPYRDIGITETEMPIREARLLPPRTARSANHLVTQRRAAEIQMNGVPRVTVGNNPSNEGGSSGVRGNVSNLDTRVEYLPAYGAIEDRITFGAVHPPSYTDTPSSTQRAVRRNSQRPTLRDLVSTPRPMPRLQQSALPHTSHTSRLPGGVRIAAPPTPLRDLGMETFMPANSSRRADEGWHMQGLDDVPARPTKRKAGNSFPDRTSHHKKRK